MKKKIIIISIISLFLLIICLLFVKYNLDSKKAKEEWEALAYDGASIDNIVEWADSKYVICVDKINERNYFDGSNEVYDNDNKIKKLITEFDYEEIKVNDLINYEYKIYINKDCIYVSFASNIITKTCVIDGHFNSAKATRYYKISDDCFTLLKEEIDKLYC